MKQTKLTPAQRPTSLEIGALWYKINDNCKRFLFVTEEDDENPFRAMSDNRSTERDTVDTDSELGE